MNTSPTFAENFFDILSCALSPRGCSIRVTEEYNGQIAVSCTDKKTNAVFLKTITADTRYSYSLYDLWRRQPRVLCSSEVFDRLLSSLRTGLPSSMTQAQRLYTEINAGAMNAPLREHITGALSALLPIPQMVQSFESCLRLPATPSAVVSLVLDSPNKKWTLQTSHSLLTSHLRAFRSTLFDKDLSDAEMVLFSQTLHIALNPNVVNPIEKDLERSINDSGVSWEHVTEATNIVACGGTYVRVDHDICSQCRKQDQPPFSTTYTVSFFISKRGRLQRIEVAAKTTNLPESLRKDLQKILSLHWESNGAWAAMTTFCLPHFDLLVEDMSVRLAQIVVRTKNGQQEMEAWLKTMLKEEREIGIQDLMMAKLQEPTLSSAQALGVCVACGRQIQENAAETLVMIVNKESPKQAWTHTVTAILVLEQKHGFAVTQTIETRDCPGNAIGWELKTTLDMYGQVTAIHIDVRTISGGTRRLNTEIKTCFPSSWERHFDPLLSQRLSTLAGVREPTVRENRPKPWNEETFLSLLTESLPRQTPLQSAATASPIPSFVRKILEDRSVLKNVFSAKEPEARAIRTLIATLDPAFLQSQKTSLQNLLRSQIPSLNHLEFQHRESSHFEGESFVRKVVTTVHEQNLDVFGRPFTHEKYTIVWQTQLTINTNGTCTNTVTQVCPNESIFPSDAIRDACIKVLSERWVCPLSTLLVEAIEATTPLIVTTPTTLAPHPTKEKGPDVEPENRDEPTSTMARTSSAASRPSEEQLVVAMMERAVEEAATHLTTTEGQWTHTHTVFDIPKEDLLIRGQSLCGVGKIDWSVLASFTDERKVKTMETSVESISWPNLTNVDLVFKKLSSSLTLPATLTNTLLPIIPFQANGVSTAYIQLAGEGLRNGALPAELLGNAITITTDTALLEPLISAIQKGIEKTSPLSKGHIWHHQITSMVEVSNASSRITHEVLCCPQVREKKKIHNLQPYTFQLEITTTEPFLDMKLTNGFGMQQLRLDITQQLISLADTYKEKMNLTPRNILVC